MFNNIKQQIDGNYMIDDDGDDIINENIIVSAL